MKKNILVLGGTGFIGSKILEILKDRKDYNISILGHKTIPYKDFEDINLVTGSLSTLNLDWLDILEPDYILHLARIPGRGKLGRYLSARRGRKANERIIRKIKELHKRPHVFYVSGTLVYGDCADRTVDENTPINPTGFAREYIIAEQPWMRESQADSIKVTILRPPWILGSKSWFKTFYLNQSDFVPQFDNGKNWMTILHVDDCAGLIVHLMRNNNENMRVINLHSLAYGAVKHNEFVKEVSMISGLEIKVFSKKEAIRSFGQTFYESFTFSCNLITNYDQLLQNYTPKYLSVSEMLHYEFHLRI